MTESPFKEPPKIIKKKSEVPLVDLMDGCDRWEIQIDEHGLVALVDIMPRLVPIGIPCDPHTVGACFRYKVPGEGVEVSSSVPFLPYPLTADGAIVQAARTSTGKGLKTPTEDERLLRYLYSHLHTSPFEMVNVKFHHVLPIFVARQLVRHRTASLNEYSLRYSQPKDRFWFPSADQLRGQSKTNKQMTEGGVDLTEAEAFLANLDEQCRDAMEKYQKAVKANIGREQARVVMPLALYTEWYWEIDLKNLLGFLGLRQDKHAQAEIRVYADAMYDLLKPLVPWSLKAYDDYHVNRGGMALSRMDIEALGWDCTSSRLLYLFPSERELREFIEKAKRLNNQDAVARANQALEIRTAVEK